MRSYFYLGDNRGLTQLSTGEFFYVNTEDRSITPWILMGGYWEIFVDDILCALAKPGQVFVDVGANMGYYTVKIGARVGPEGRVYSFEPNPHMFGFLSDNIMINAFEDRARPFPVAAGGEAGEAFFSFTRREPGGGWVHAETLGDENEMRVQVATLDDMIPSDRPVDLIKIDVEGFEPEVLKGMKALMARSPNAAMVLEASFTQWSRFGDPVSLLREAAGGRDVYRIHPRGSIELAPSDRLESVMAEKLGSYLLLLPRSRAGEVAQFIGEKKDSRPLSLRLSRFQRLKRRVKHWLNAS